MITLLEIKRRAAWSLSCGAPVAWRRGGAGKALVKTTTHRLERPAQQRDDGLGKAGEGDFVETTHHRPDPREKALPLAGQRQPLHPHVQSIRQPHHPTGAGHAVDRARQRRSVDRREIGELAHRKALLAVERCERSPLRHAQAEWLELRRQLTVPAADDLREPEENVRIEIETRRFAWRRWRDRGLRRLAQAADRTGWRAALHANPRGARHQRQASNL